MTEQHINYIHENPLRNRLIVSADEYLSSARNYAELSSVIDIDTI